MSRNSKSSSENPNTEFERKILRDLGLREDYVPRDEHEAHRLVTAWLESHK
jgi:hypothetical protein